MWPCLGQQSSTGQTTQSDQKRAHDSVMKFLQGIRLAALPEGKRLLSETQWILGQADRGRNYYSRPEYTEVASLYAGLFDTDNVAVKGYKELFDMKAVTKAGTTRNVKYLAISFKDADSGKWRILSTLDNVDDESGLDIDYAVEYFKSRLTDTQFTSAKDNYATYGTSLLRSGRIQEAKAALEKAKGASGISGLDVSLKTNGDPVIDIQIDVLLAVIAKIVPQTGTTRQ